ncbi:MAG: DUF1697 domain-containing protein, partial [bacterium]|nr:DUF1697 domain-containing protein [bacterium]
MVEESLARNTVVLIRGINVGRAKRVAMADLRDLIGKLGYSDVRTILNSGNVVFNDSLSDPVSAGERIEEAIAAHLGVSARVTALTVTELDAIVRDNPLLDQAEIPSRLIVAVFSQPRLVSLVEPLLEQVWTPELLALG